MRAELLCVSYICIGCEIILHLIQIRTEDMYGSAEMQIHSLFFSTRVTLWTQSFLEQILMLLQLDTPVELSEWEKGSWEVESTFHLWCKDRNMLKTVKYKKQNTKSKHLLQCPNCPLRGSNMLESWGILQARTWQFPWPHDQFALDHVPQWHSHWNKIPPQFHQQDRKKKWEERGASLASEGQSERLKHILR